MASSRKLSTAQRVAIGYYRARLNLLFSISPKRAARLALKIFTTPYRVKRKPEPPIWKQAESLWLDTGFGKMAGFCWKAHKPAGKKMLIVHGFAGNARAFDKYIKPALAKGYDVYAYDAPAHGRSPGKQLTVVMYMELLHKINQQHNGFDAYLAHSLGALSLMLSLHENGLQNYPKIVLIAPATESVTAADHFFNFLHLPQAMRSLFDQLIIDMGGHPLKWYAVSRVVAQVKADILWLHDEEDRTTPIADVLPVINLHLPNVRFYLTKGLGHSRIYNDNKVRKEIYGFLDIVEYL